MGDDQALLGLWGVRLRRQGTVREVEWLWLLLRQSTFVVPVSEDALEYAVLSATTIPLLTVSGIVAVMSKIRFPTSQDLFPDC